MSFIKFIAIRKTFGDVIATDTLDLEIDQGEFVVLVGPSGCGKTTVLRMVAGLESPDSGRLELDGRDITALSPRDRDVAMVFQNYALYPHMSVRRNLGFGLRMRGAPRAEIETEIGRVAERLGISELLDRAPSQLSGGQRQRVALGRAIVRKPKLFLMDEPLSNLDAELRVSTRAELLRLHEQLGVTTLYVTHDQVEAMTLGNRLVVMNRGRVEQVGEPETVYREPRSVFVARFLGSPRMNIVPAELSANDGARLEVDGAVVTLESVPGRRGGPVLAGFRPEAAELGASASGDAPQRTEQGPRLELRGRLDLVENLGKEKIAVVRLAGGELVEVVASSRLRLEKGAEVEVTVPPGELHLFDRESGERLAR